MGKKKKISKKPTILGYENIFFHFILLFSLNFYVPKCLVSSILDILQHYPQGVTQQAQGERNKRVFNCRVNHKKKFSD